MSALRGTAPLVRLILRRDRVRLLAWVVGIIALVVATAASTKSLYPTQASLDAVATAAHDNPVALAFNGPDQALDTMGGQVAFQVGAFGLLMVGLMSVLLLGRLTRAEEDSGRLELVRSMPVGRHAPLTAALVVVIGTNLVVGVAVAVSLLLEDLPTAGSVTFGASFAVFGLVFVGVTAASAQVSENPRVTTGAAGAVLGASFVLRAAGDMGDGTLSWLSPMGWAQRSRPYAGEVWWPLALCAVVGVVLVQVAATLAAHRDFGAGMVAPSPGPPTAAPGLRSPLGLALRLHRGAVTWWALAAFALGVVYGSLTQSIEDFIGDNPAMEKLLAALGGASLTDSYLATSLLILALLATGPALQIVQRLRTEETETRAEMVLATGTSRPRWITSHLAVALGAGALALVLGGFGLGLADAAVGGDAGEVPRLVGAALAYVPAVWLLTGLGVALFGLLPRWTAAGWVALTACLVIAMFGELLDLPTWVRDLSPFQHTPAAPAADLRGLPLAVLSTTAAAMIALGLASFRHRDIATA